MSLSANMFSSCKLKNLEIRFPFYKYHSNNKGRVASSSWGQSRRSLGFLDCFAGLLVWLEGQSSASSAETKQLNLQELSELNKNSVLGFCKWFILSLNSWFLGYMFWTVRIALCLCFGMNLIRYIINTNTSCDWNYICDILNNTSITFKTNSAVWSWNKTAVIFCNP